MEDNKKGEYARRALPPLINKLFGGRFSALLTVIHASVLLAELLKASRFNDASLLTGVKRMAGAADRNPHITYR